VTTVTSLRELDGPDLYTPVVMAIRGPKAQALAADLADTVTFAAWPGDSRAEMMRLAADFRATRDVELALHVPVVGDAVAPFMTPPDTDPAAATEEILRRREDSGFSYFVVGANAADALAPVVAELTGH
jgi:alkanesulfonate monooxygenase SsuD/methylene tetrahydromethanopterin reductase-like flavin-dependent oxidoreductase (luciferase family)